MNIRFRLSAVVVCLALFTTACNETLSQLSEGLQELDEQGFLIENLRASMLIEGPNSVRAGQPVTLTASFDDVSVIEPFVDLDGEQLTVKWDQVAGSPVAITSDSVLTIEFTAPLANEIIAFTIHANDRREDGPKAVHEIVVVYDQKPVAYAGLDQTVNVGAFVTLNAAGSRDPESGAIEYQWTQVDGPAVELDTIEALAEFDAPDVVTELTFSLRVTDGVSWSLPDLVRVFTNQGPTSNAGPEQTVAGGDVVTLDASGSFDPDGDDITYKWEQISGDTVVLSDARARQPTFVAPSRGQTLLFRMVASDGKSNDGGDVAQVNIRNIPVAEAGDNQTIVNGDDVLLVGSGIDSDGNPANKFAWHVESAPAGATWALVGANTSNLTFSPLGPGFYQLGLQASIDDLVGTTDFVVVEVLNRPPAVTPGPDVTVTNTQPASVFVTTSDPDGDSMTVRWEVESAPLGATFTWDDNTILNPTFTPNGRGTYVLRADVTDSNGGLTSARVYVQAANNAPTLIGSPVTAFSVPNGQDLFIQLPAQDTDGDSLTYIWLFPDSQVTVLSGQSTFAIELRTSAAGNYGGQLLISDGSASTVIDIQIESTNNAPTATVDDAELTTENGKLVTLSGSISDPDGDPASAYIWEVVNAPGAATYVISTTTASGIAEFTPYGIGTYDLRFAVSDGQAQSSWVNVEVESFNRAPTLSGTALYNTNNGQSVQLTAIYSDPDGDPLDSVSWSVLSVPSGALYAISQETTLTPWFTPQGRGTYQLQADVSDGNGGAASKVFSVVALNSIPSVVVSGFQGQNLAGTIIEATGTDADGDSLTYFWSVASTPPGASPVLVGANSSQPTITPDKVGIYNLDVYVNDGLANSAVTTMVFTALNNPPVANAGFDQSGLSGGESTVLNGTLSNDPDGDTIDRWRWTQTDGETISLPDNDSATSFNVAIEMPNTKGTYRFALDVSDGTAYGSLDYVELVVDNLQPVADAGLNAEAQAGSLVTMTATGSDPDGDPITGYQWTQVGGPTVGLSGAGSQNVSFIMANDLQDPIVLELIVFDGAAWSAPDQVTITALPAPGCCIFVSDDQTQSGNGTFGSPFSTIAQAVAAADGSLPIIVDDGTYPERVNITDGDDADIYGGYTSTGTQWKTSNTRYGAVLQVSADYDRGFNISSLTTKRTVQGFHIQTTQSSGADIAASSIYGVVCSACTIDLVGNKITMDGRNVNLTQGIHINSSLDVQVLNSEIIGGFALKNEGIYAVNGADDLTISDNQIQMRPKLTQSNQYRYGIHINSATPSPSITRNRIIVPGAADETWCVGIYSSHALPSDGGNIDYNVFDLSQNFCTSVNAPVYTRQAQNWTFFRNSFFGNGQIDSSYSNNLDEPAQVAIWAQDRDQGVWGMYPISRYNYTHQIQIGVWGRVWGNPAGLGEWKLYRNVQQQLSFGCRAYYAGDTFWECKDNDFDGPEQTWGTCNPLDIANGDYRLSSTSICRNGTFYDVGAPDDVAAPWDP